MPAQALIRDAGCPRWLAFDEPVTVLEAADAGQVRAVITEAEGRARSDGLYAVGFLTYEAAAGLDPKLAVRAPGRLPPAWFALFEGPRPAADPASPCHVPLMWQPSLDAAAYRLSLARIRELIAAGDTYQVNFSYRLRTSLEAGDGHPARRLFGAMIARQPGGLGAFVETDAWAICSASHELFFTRRGRRLTCRPMKGTAPRGVTERDDVRHARWLRDSLKNRAENLMITDMVRNDLGRLADVGSVRTESVFHLERYPTLWQMTSTVHGNTDARLPEIFTALFPAASITGAPKRRSMEIIRELEADPREIYTGTVGMIRPDGDAQFNVAIRTALVDGRAGRAEYGVGGGILWDSDADEEHRETLTKARILEPGTTGDFALLETLLWQPGEGFRLLQEHLTRLQSAARRFYRRSVDEAAIRARLNAAATGLPPLPHRIRLLVGEDLVIRVSATPLEPDSAPRRVGLARAPAALAGNPFVAHKTTRREDYEVARRALAAALPEAEDVLLINEHGEVTESTIANLVVDLAGVLVTPPTSAGLLPGVYRQHLLDTGGIVERPLRPADLRAARALYLVNSVRGLWQVELLPG